MSTNICSKCGTVNLPTSWRCKSCFGILRVDAAKTQNVNPDILQPQEPVLTKVDQEPPAYVRPDVEEPFQTEGASEAEIIPERTDYGKPGLKNPLVLIGGVIGLLAILAVAFVAIGSGGEASLSASEQFAAAEGLVASGQLEAALSAYSEFRNTFPESDLVGLAGNRIAALNDSLNQRKLAQTEELATLISKAETTFSKKQFVVPDDDNVILYTRAILALDPDNSQALALEERVIDYYHQQADRSVKRGRLQRAIGYYERVLSFQPEHQTTLNHIQLLKRRLK